MSLDFLTGALGVVRFFVPTHLFLSLCFLRRYLKHIAKMTLAFYAGLGNTGCATLYYLVWSVYQERNDILMQEQDKRASKPLSHGLMVMLRSRPQITQVIRSKPSSEQFTNAKEALITRVRNDGTPEETIRLFEAFIEAVAAASYESREDR